MTHRPPPLFLRLLLLTLPIESLILALFGIWLVRGIERRDEAAFDEELRVQREAMLSGAAMDGAGSLRINLDLNRRALAPGTRGCFLDEQGTILWESPPGWFRSSGLSMASEEVTETLRTLSLGGSWTRIISAARRVKRLEDAEAATGPLAQVILARPLSGLEQSHREFRRKAVAAGGTLLALTAVLLWVAIKIGLNPVGRMIRGLHDVPGPAGADRLDETCLPSELRPLAREINGLSDRLWGLVQLERRFAAEAAHELRTPLTLVKSTLQTALLAGGSRGDHERALQEALEDLQRLERTAESLLVLARADALVSSQPPFQDSVSLSGLLKAVAERFAPSAKEKGLDLMLDLAPCAVRGEHVALERLFVNLVDNAVKYAKPPGKITLRCSPGEGSVLAAVEDTGPSIPEEERPHLFQQFFRGASGRTVTAPGAGLGLTIAAAMARLHHARLTCEPGDLEGNRFVVRFPADHEG